MLQMLIIGGGIHGVHLAHRLLHDAWLTQDDIRILDSHEQLLREWWRCMRNGGMQYLRSPWVHNIDIFTRAAKCSAGSRNWRNPSRHPA